MNRFEGALQQIDGWIGSNGVPGAAAVVWHRGSIVGERYAGVAQLGIPVDERTLFPLASVTKPITASTVMTLIDLEKLILDEPVASYIPEYPAASSTDDRLRESRSNVTIRRLLAHLSGLPEDLPKGTFRSREMPDLEEITDVMCRQPLRVEPGSEHLYSNSGYGVLGRVVERVTGEDFWDMTWRNVLEPLELHDVVARPGPLLNERIALVRDPNGEGRSTESYNSRYWRDLGMPWAGLFGTARDLVRFAATFLLAGDGFLTPSLAMETITDQVKGLPGGVQSARVVWPVAYWGLGWEVKGHKEKHWTGNKTSPATFCHYGAAGTLLWADPAVGLAAAVFANRSTFKLWPFVPPRWASLSDELIDAVR
jgi:CubicO group peptidase (beta-lactamase class C family)